MPGKSHKINETTNGDCLKEDLLYRYLEKMTTQEEEERIEQHLNECNNCFADVTALTEIIQTPITEAEKIEIAQTRKISPEEQVQKILDYIETESSSSNTVWAKNTQTTLSEGDLKPDKIAASWKKFVDFFKRPIPGYASLRVTVLKGVPVSRYAFAFALTVIGVLAVLLPYQIFINKDADNYYVYDEQLPYDYNMSSLRGAQSGAEADSLLLAFVNQFRLGMADYLSRDYASAVGMFQSLEPVVLLLQQTRSENEKILPWLRDYFFYSGVSHFALSRSRVSDLSPEVKQQHAAASIRWLAGADSLVTARHLEGGDREIYFLGLAYGFAGRRNSGVAQLRRINTESQFYNNSIDLIHQWAKL